MSKDLFIAEKPSVAAAFAEVLQVKAPKKNGYMEDDAHIITWCVGHLVTMSYPEKYDSSMKKWSLNTLPFIPEKYLYEIIPSVSAQFKTVKSLLNRKDVSCIYVCTDAGREGEYIYRLVEQMANVKGKVRKRVWIDSQTQEEILRGIREAKDLSEYDALASSAYLRAQEDYLMGINFSRLLTLKYGNTLSGFLNQRYTVIAVGRVMTCVLGMIVRREREIRSFVKTPFYKIEAEIKIEDQSFDAELKINESSHYYGYQKLYKNIGFLEKKDAEGCIAFLSQDKPFQMELVSIEKKQEKKNPPLLYNLAELQNEASRLWKLSPDETLKVAQELYEKKLITYPRTDARVLSSAVAMEIGKNLQGLTKFSPAAGFADKILKEGLHQGIVKSRYVNDKAVTDHYAIIPTGQTGRYGSLSDTAKKVYEAVCRRFLAIFYPPAVYQKVNLTLKRYTESFFAGCKVLKSPGYLEVYGNFFGKKEDEDVSSDTKLLSVLQSLKRGMTLYADHFYMKEGETTPPKRYNSGAMILAMENAGQLIEDEELRAQIKGSGIGTSATRAEILKKLVNNKYVKLNKKTQILTPTLLGELICDTVSVSIKSLLNPELTASWEKGLTMVAEKQISGSEYSDKLNAYIGRRVEAVLNLNNQSLMRQSYDQIRKYYK